MKRSLVLTAFGVAAAAMLVGSLKIGDFKMTLHGGTAIVTHEDPERLDYFGQVIESRWRKIG